MIFSDKVYNVLKWLCLIALPAAATLYTALSALWGWPNAQAVSGTITAIATLIGTLIGVSNSNYNKKESNNGD